MSKKHVRDGGKTVTVDEIVKVLVDSGYRKVSNKYRTMARVDVAVPPKECYGQHTKLYLGDDHYRRCFSKDKITVPVEVSRRMPTSGHDETGFLPLSPRLPEALVAMHEMRP